MAVYVKRRRIVLLIVIICFIYFVFNLIIIGKSIKKSREKELKNMQENTLLSDQNAAPGDYTFDFNNDDYFLTDEEELLKTGHDTAHLQQPKRSELNRGNWHPGIPTSIPKIEVVVEKPELFHTFVENNPENGFDHDFEAFGTTRARTYHPMEPDSKDPVPLILEGQETIFFFNTPTIPPQHPDSQGYPELKPKVYPTTVDSNPESGIDAFELTDFETFGANDVRTYPPIGPDSIIPVPKIAIDQKTIFHSKSLATTPDPQGYFGFKLVGKNESIVVEINSSLPTEEIATALRIKNESEEYTKIKSVGNDKFPNSEIQKTTKNPALIIDTPGCKIPKFNPWDPSVANLIQIFGAYNCPFPPLFMTPGPNGIINLNVSVLEKYYNSTLDDINCWYQPIMRTYLSTNNREDDYYTLPVQELKFGEPIEHEYLITKCFFKHNNTHEQYIPLVKLKDEVEKRKSVIKSPSPLNVIILGIDSVSKLNFMRRFFQTKPYLKFQMKAFDMKGFTKVGDNTFPNLVPMFTGHFVNYFWNESIKDTYFFDDVPFIWKEYARYGHRTFFAEDAPYNGAFNFIKRGFLEPPADYYYRPLALAIEQSELRKKGFDTNSPCLNSELETDLMYAYLLNFIKTMGTRPYFAFCMTSTLTHDFFDAAGFADAPAAKLLKVLDEEGALNSSAFIFFSDHGIRYGDIRQTYIGKFEERMPFMYLHFPKWFLDQHPDFERNLAINQDRLTNVFDIHATLKHLLHINDGLIEENDELGLSLFNEIPEDRTCADAHIQEHYCACNNFNKVSEDNDEVYIVSLALVAHVNSLLVNHTDKCEELSLDEIKDARLGLPNDIVLNLEQEEDKLINKTLVIGEAPPLLGDYMVTLSVKPGGAIIEGTVRYDAKNLIPIVFGVSRINMYGTQSWCIDSQVLKLYCYCKFQPF